MAAVRAWGERKGLEGGKGAGQSDRAGADPSTAAWSLTLDGCTSGSGGRACLRFQRADQAGTVLQARKGERVSPSCLFLLPNESSGNSQIAIRLQGCGVERGEDTQRRSFAFILEVSSVKFVCVKAFMT